MSIAGRAKRLGGGDPTYSTVDVASGGTIAVGQNDTFIALTAAGAYSTATTQIFISPGIRPGRRLFLYNSGSTNTITLKATAVGSAGEGYLATKSDIALGANGDSCELIQLANGSWLPITLAVDNG